MNCSEFNLGLKELVETRGASSSESLLLGLPEYLKLWVTWIL